MAKGFGVKQGKQLGYILVLMPEANAYAAKFSLDFDGSGEQFIGIANMLEEAQTWKTQKLAKQAIETDYAALQGIVAEVPGVGERIVAGVDRTGGKLSRLSFGNRLVLNEIGDRGFTNDQNVVEGDGTSLSAEAQQVKIQGGKGTGGDATQVYGDGGGGRSCR